MRAKILGFLAVVTLAVTVSAQSPMPVIVPAMTPAATTKAPAAISENSSSIQAALKILEQIKAANEETLKKQTATLEQLDELEKAAEQIKIYTKRS
jgi:esterase/lipase